MTLYHALPSSPGLFHSDSVSTMMKKVHKHYLGRLTVYEEVAREGTDIEGLHGLRVSIRYLKVFTSIFKNYIPQHLLIRMKPMLKIAGKDTGQLRDLDVFQMQYMVNSVEDNINVSQSFESFIKNLYEHRRLVLLDYLNSAKHKALINSINEIIDIDNEITNTNQYDFIYRVINKRLEKVNNVSRSLDWNEYHELHQLRIRIKQLRYSIEIFKELFIDNGEALLKILKKLQNKLGVYCDSNMAEGLIKQYILEYENIDLCAKSLLDQVNGENRQQLIEEVRSAWREYMQMDISATLEGTLDRALS